MIDDQLRQAVVYYLDIAGSLSTILRPQDTAWPNRDDVMWYVSRCEMAGFCTTDDLRRRCAERYLAGKRAVTPPGTRRRKVRAKRTRELLVHLPAGLLEALEEGKRTKAWAQYVGGNEKAVNAVIGPLIKRFGVTFEVVSTLIKQTAVQQ